MLFVATTDWLVDNARDVDWSTATVSATLLVQSNGLGGSDYENPNTVDAVVGATEGLADLLVRPEFQQAAVAASSVGTSASGAGAGAAVEVSLDAQFEFVCDPFYLDAVAISLDGTHGGVVDPLLMVFRAEPRFTFGGTAAHPGIVRYSTSSETPYLFSFLTAPADPADDTGSEASAGPVEIAVPVLDWESAHAAHVWMYPQRTNLVANPSFESLGDDDELFGWRTDSVLTRQTGGVGPGSRTHCAHLSGPSSTKVAESNLFPVSNETTAWSVEAAVAGTGTCRVGILFWEPGMADTGTHYVYEEFTLSGGSDLFTVHRALLDVPEDVWLGQFRLEFDGTECWVDNVLVEPSEARGGYFDGSWPMGQAGDYRWYNYENAPPEDVNHKSYSLYYPDRVRTERTLFGWTETVDGAEVQHRGLAAEYVTEGTRIVAHWDDVYYGRTNSWSLDLRVPVQDFSDKTTVAPL